MLAWVAVVDREASLRRSCLSKALKEVQDWALLLSGRARQAQGVQGEVGGPSVREASVAGARGRLYALKPERAAEGSLQGGNFLVMFPDQDLCVSSSGGDVLTGHCAGKHLPFLESIVCSTRGTVLPAAPPRLLPVRRLVPRLCVSLSWENRNFLKTEINLETLTSC